ncbi:MAG TPA: hemerythrin domain-containing protein [Puia sp.]|nr:hemerythrin domain-containing protein [Puia sp.]
MTPIKRHSALQPLSHDHHQALLVSWKIRMGLRKAIEPQRIKKFCDFFYKSHLAGHFKLEEEYIFPILGAGHELITTALADHYTLSQLFTQKQADVNTLTRIEKELEEHIRFEERILFDEIQKIATEEQLNLAAAVRPGGKEDIERIESWKDEFWL